MRDSILCALQPTIFLGVLSLRHYFYNKKKWEGNQSYQTVWFWHTYLDIIIFYHEFCLLIFIVEHLILSAFQLFYRLSHSNSLLFTIYLISFELVSTLFYYYALMIILCTSLPHYLAAWSNMLFAQFSNLFQNKLYKLLGQSLVIDSLVAIIRLSGQAVRSTPPW